VLLAFPMCFVSLFPLILAGDFSTLNNLGKSGEVASLLTPLSTLPRFRVSMEEDGAE
jgi:hypothetical protein